MEKMGPLTMGHLPEVVFREVDRNSHGVWVSCTDYSPTYTLEIGAFGNKWRWVINCGGYRGTAGLMHRKIWWGTKVAKRSSEVQLQIWGNCGGINPAGFFFFLAMRFGYFSTEVYIRDTERRE